MERPGDPSEPTAAAVATLLGCLACTTWKLHLGDGDKMGAGKVGKGTKMERKTLLKGLQLPVNEMDEIFLMVIPSQLGVE